MRIILTHSQMRMWFMHAMDPRRTDLTIACAARLRAGMDVTELQERLRSVVLDNPLLAVVIAEVAGNPQWEGVPARDAIEAAVRPTVRAGSIEHAHMLYGQFVNRPWVDLDREIPWAVQLVTTDEATFLLCKFHHIICDGDRSLRLFFEGLTTRRGFVSAPDLADVLADPPRSETWDSTIARLTESIVTPVDLRQRIVDPGAWHSDRHHWDGTLEQVGLRPGERDEVVLLERFRMTVRHLVGAGQLLVAIPFDGGTCAQRDQIGYFGNPGLAVLPADDADGQWAVREYARAEKLATIPFQTIMSHERFRQSVLAHRPFDILLVPRSLFTYRSPLVHSVSEPIRSHTPYALVLNHWRDTDQQLRIALESTVFEEEVLAHLGQRMVWATAEPKHPMPASGPALPPRIDLNDSDIITRLEAVVDKHRDHVAIETRGIERVSYGQLWDYAQVLAEFLGENLRNGHRTIAIVGDKHPNEIVCTLGVHIFGGTVVRLDRDEAATRRIIATLTDIAAVIQLDNSQSVVLAADNGPEHTLSAPFGDYRVSVATARPVSAPGTTDGPAPALYITMTSGSTGQPKPIPFPRVEFNALISWHLRTFPGLRRMLQFSRLSFDVAYHEIYATLCSGGTLVVGNSAIREDPKELLDYIKTAQIQKLYLPTVLLHPLAETALAGGCPTPTPSLREVIVAGGSLEITAEIRKWFAHTFASLFNNYGMSETQDVTSHFLPGPPDSWPARPPVGLPIDGVDVRVVGSGAAELPPSLIGSVVIRSRTGVTDTGDVGYKDRHGLLHILGRGDRILKRRGFRVNMEALQAEVARAPGVSEAVAVVYASPCGTTSIAVVATEQRGGCAVNPIGLKEQVVKSLGNGYEFNLHFVAAIPRLPNSKPDLLGITQMVEELASNPVTEPPAEAGGSTVLEAVCRLASDAAVDDHTRFLDVGLDSISLMSLAALLQADHPGLSVADFFQHPTIGGLQRHLDRPTRCTGEHVGQGRGPVTTSSEVSVVGCAGRFPGAPDIDTFWENLLNGKSTLMSAATPHKENDDPHSTFVGVHGNLSDVDMFDHTFFGITAAEACRMDPQIRVFLQLCWVALENASEADDMANKNIGIFAGAGLSTYLLNEVEPRRLLATDQTPFLEYNTLQERLGADRNFLTSTVSYRLGLTGPSIVVQAACATSLTAVHMARQSLISGECDVALAGGVSIIYPQPDGYNYVDGSVRSRRGECRPFDQHADGTVFGNGAGVVVLKRAADAKADRNTVDAEIIGSAVNHDGAIKGSFTAPNPSSQTRVIDAALQSAGVEGLDLNFVETHGTGTFIGDAIEWNALLASRINDTGGRPSACIVGSVKGNVGHLDEAAGIAGLIKACLSVRHRIYPGTHGFTKLHPRLVESDRFTVSATNNELPKDSAIYAAVSSFGMGGANCHVVIRSPETPGDTSNDASSVTILADHTEPLYLPVSGKTRDALTDASDVLATHLDRHAEGILASDVIHTLTTGRNHFVECRGVLLRGPGSTRLVTVAGSDDDRAPSRCRDTVWAFPGQGSGFSWQVVAGLGRWPVFARKFRQLLGQFMDHLSPAVFDMHVGYAGDSADPLAAPTGAACAERCTIREQVLLFSFQLALAGLLESFGVGPDAVVGHSLGEITAAVCAGRISEADAVALVSQRSQLMDAVPAAGFMMQLGCDLNQAAHLAGTLDLDIAAINGPRHVVLAGDQAREDALRRIAGENNIDVVRLNVMSAFHSRMMRGAAEVFGRLDLDLHPGLSSVEFVGSNQLNECGGGPADLAYWASQLTSPVDYMSACEVLLSRPGRMLFMELGFTSMLTNLIRAIAATQSSPEPVLVGGVRTSVPEYVAKVTAATYQLKASIDWEEVNQVHGGGLIPLPSYPFARTTIPSYGSGMPLRPEPKRFPASSTATGMTVSPSAPQGRTAVSWCTTNREPINSTGAPAAPSGVIVWAVATVLNVPPAEVAVERTLTDNGVDSLTLMEVRSLIERQTGVRIPLNSLSLAPSLEAIRELVVPVPVVADLPQEHDPSLGDTSTIFYVAGIFGRVDGAPDLERAVGGSITMVILSSPTRKVGAPGRLDVCEVAKDLADQVEDTQPDGPLTVLGHSFGAMLAYSVAVELRHRGRVLQQLVVIDGGPVGSPSPLGVDALATRAAIEEEFDALISMSTGAGRSARESLTADSLSIAFDSYQANCEIERSRQVVDEVDCPILIAIPEEQVGLGLSPSRVTEFHRVAGEKLGGTSVDVIRVPGNHFSMLRSPNVEHLIKHVIAVNLGDDKAK